MKKTRLALGVAAGVVVITMPAGNDFEELSNQAGDVSSQLRAVATMAKDNNLSEFEAIQVLAGQMEDYKKMLNEAEAIKQRLNTGEVTPDDLEEVITDLERIKEFLVPAATQALCDSVKSLSSSQYISEDLKKETTDCATDIQAKAVERLKDYEEIVANMREVLASADEVQHQASEVVADEVQHQASEVVADEVQHQVSEVVADEVQHQASEVVADPFQEAIDFYAGFKVHEARSLEITNFVASLENKNQEFDQLEKAKRRAQNYKASLNLDEVRAFCQKAQEIEANLYASVDLKENAQNCEAEVLEPLKDFLNRYDALIENLDTKIANAPKKYFVEVDPELVVTPDLEPVKKQIVTQTNDPERFGMTDLFRVDRHFMEGQPEAARQEALNQIWEKAKILNPKSGLADWVLMNVTETNDDREPKQRTFNCNEVAEAVVENHFCIALTEPGAPLSAAEQETFITISNMKVGVTYLVKRSTTQEIINDLRLKTSSF